jgi:hypothetical protein
MCPVGWVSKGWKNKLEEGKQGEHTNNRDNDWPARGCLPRHKPDSTKEETRKPQIGHTNHGGFGQAIKEKPVDADGNRDARYQNEFIDGFHFLMFD